MYAKASISSDSMFDFRALRAAFIFFIDSRLFNFFFSASSSSSPSPPPPSAVAAAAVAVSSLMGSSGTASGTASELANRSFLRGRREDQPIGR